MSSFTVDNNAVLRSLYKSTDSKLTKKSARQEAAKPKLIFSDTSALRKGIKALADEDYGDEDEDDSKITKADFYKKMKAFADSYNYTVESSSSYSTKDTREALRKMKKLVNQYSDDLDNLGVTFDDDGYMTLSESAFDNIDEAKFESSFGKDSDFMNQLDSIAKKLNRHIDVQA